MISPEQPPAYQQGNAYLRQITERTANPPGLVWKAPRALLEEISAPLKQTSDTTAEPCKVTIGAGAGAFQIATGEGCGISRETFCADLFPLAGLQTDKAAAENSACLTDAFHIGSDVAHIMVDRLQTDGNFDPTGIDVTPDQVELAAQNAVYRIPTAGEKIGTYLSARTADFQKWVREKTDLILEKTDTFIAAISAGPNRLLRGITAAGLVSAIGIIGLLIRKEILSYKATASGNRQQDE